MSEGSISTVEIASNESKQTKKSWEIGSPFQNIDHKLTKVSAPSETQGQPDLRPVPEDRLIHRKDHGRDLTVDTNGGHALWGDKFDVDVLGDRTIKGTVMNPPPHVEPDPYNKVHTLGLMDQKFAGRIVTASEMMRACGLPTEVPRSFNVLREILIKNTDGTISKVSIDKWKKREIARIENEIADLSENNPVRKEKEEFLENVKIYFQDVKFVAMTRDVQINLRLEDIFSEIKKNNLANTMEPIFKWLNTVMKTKNRGLITGSPTEKPFKTSPEDLARYFGEYYPSQAGAYLGVMRANGFASNFLNPGNWQGVPTVLDLDSFSGHLIDGPGSKNLPSVKDFMTDLIDTTNDIGQLFQCLKENSSLGEVDYDKLLSKASYLLFKNYFKTAFGKRLNEKVINQIITSGSPRSFFFPNEQIPAINRLAEEVKKEKGFFGRLFDRFAN